jgi:pyruvate dehydrogenase E2 component (dihydrolipoamide acetyltransferase)
LAAVEATGVDGTVTREDVLRTAETISTLAQSEPAANDAVAAGPTVTAPAPAPWPRHSIPVRGITRSMAAAMVRSVQQVPHVTEWVQADVTDGIRTLRALVRSGAVPEVAATPLLLAAAGLLRAVARHPIVNGRWDDAGGTIEIPAEVNLGIAVASPRGLVVPNLKSAQGLNLPDLAAGLTDLIASARQGRATPADLTGGTITITNVGVFGIDGGTPIINPPEAAILCLGQVARRPWVVDDAVVPREVVELTLSFDHRFIDGATGSGVLADVARYMSDPGLTALLDTAHPAAGVTSQP